MSSFLSEYDRRYALRLKHRARTFRQVFAYLESLARPEYLLLETGCLRAEGSWTGDGQSTLLFDRFVNVHGGQVLSVDHDSQSCQAARRLVSARTHVVCQDSVGFLWGLAPSRSPDLVYLDSFDLDWSDPHPSALHHLQELCALVPVLAPGSLVVVDDNSRERGKGIYLRRFFQALGIAPCFDEYQVGWILPERAARASVRPAQREVRS